MGRDGGFFVLKIKNHYEKKKEKNTVSSEIPQLRLEVKGLAEPVLNPYTESAAKSGISCEKCLPVLLTITQREQFCL